MTCGEFQKVLPYIIESGGNAEEEAHLKECPVCSDLVRDLRYIAEQAKLLVPMEEPAARVWEGIQDSLQREGLVQPARRGRLLGRQRAGMSPWFASMAALALIALGAILYQRQPQRMAVTEPAAEGAALASDNGMSAADDEKILTQVAAHDPGRREVYASGLKQVNAAIAETRRAIEQDPNDSEARQMLEQAYEQKSMMYEMAISSSLP